MLADSEIDKIGRLLNDSKYVTHVFPIYSCFSYSNCCYVKDIIVRVSEIHRAMN